MDPCHPEGGSEFDRLPAEPPSSPSATWWRARLDSLGPHSPTQKHGAREELEPPCRPLSGDPLCEYHPASVAWGVPCKLVGWRVRVRNLRGAEVVHGPRPSLEPQSRFQTPKPPQKDVVNNKSAPASRTLVGAVLQNARNMSSVSVGGSASMIEMGRSQSPPSSNQVRRRAP